MRSGSFSTGTVITNRGRFTKSVKMGPSLFWTGTVITNRADLLQ